VRGWTLAVLVWTWPAAAQAEAVAPRIFWTAPTECPGLAQVVGRVEQFLRQPLSQSTQQPLTIDGQVSRSGQREYRVVLRFETGNQRRQRQLVHEDCAKLTEAAALVMAMAIDPDRFHASESTPAPDVQRRKETSSNVVANGTLNRSSPDPSDAAKVPQGAHSRAIRLHLGVAGWVQAGVLPGLAPGLSADAGLSPVPALRLSVTGNYGFTSSKTLSDVPGAKASFSMWSLGARTCWIHAGKWELATCAMAEIGRITGRGVGIDSPTTAADTWAALSLGLRETRYLTDAFGLTLGAQLGWSLLQPIFGVKGLGEVYRPEVWMARADLGLVTVFP
jgi:hypothetical protein